MIVDVEVPAVSDGIEAPSEERARAGSVVARLGALQRRYPVMQLVALAALFVVGSTTLPGFAQVTSLKTMLILSAFLGIAAMGQQICVLIGGGDLSVPSFIVLGNFMIPQLWGADHWPFVAAMALLLSIAIVVGGDRGLPV